VTQYTVEVRPKLCELSNIVPDSLSVRVENVRAETLNQYIGVFKRRVIAVPRDMTTPVNNDNLVALSGKPFCDSRASDSSANNEKGAHLLIPRHQIVQLALSLLR
jgi:hypothetical protein